MRRILLSLPFLLLALSPAANAQTVSVPNTLSNGSLAEADAMNANFGALRNAVGVTVPNTFVNGTPADANEVNANFQALKTGVETCLANAAAAAAGNQAVCESVGGTWDGASCTAAPCDVTTNDAAVALAAAAAVDITTDNAAVAAAAGSSACTQAAGTWDAGSETCTAAVAYAWSNIVVGSIASHNVASHTNIANINSCKTLCEQEPQCQSIDYRAGTGACQLGDCQVGDGTCTNDDDANYQYSALTRSILGDPFFHSDGAAVCTGVGGTWNAGSETCTAASSYNCFVGGFCAHAASDFPPAEFGYPNLYEGDTQGAGAALAAGCNVSPGSLSWESGIDLFGSIFDGMECYEADLVTQEMCYELPICIQ